MNLEPFALSVLLHDLGKFWERSSDAPLPGSDEKQHFCPYHPESGLHANLHAAYSALFIREWVKIPGAERWGAKHHLPDSQSREEVCACLGDLLSWGDAEADESRDSHAAATTPLQSILAGDAATLQHPLVRLDQVEEALAPRAHAPLSREDYRHHWHYFLKALDQLGTPLTSLETWVSLLEVFTARIPAAATNRQMKLAPQINLFDHSRAAAAIAVALWQSPRSLDELNRLRAEFFRAEPGQFPELAALAGVKLLGGETILQSGGSASPANMLGRRIFLDFLVEALARRFLYRLELPLTSWMARGDGAFLILAPPLPEGAISSIGDELEDLLWEEGWVDLGIETACLPLGLAEFHGGAGAAAAALAKNLSAAEAGHLARRARRNYDQVFGFLDRASASEDCPACSGSGEAICERCRDFESMGLKFKSAGAIARKAVPPEELKGCQRLLARIHGAVELVDAGEATLETGGLEAVFTTGKLDLNFLSAFKGSGRALGWRIVSPAAGASWLDGSAAALHALRNFSSIAALSGELWRQRARHKTAGSQPPPEVQRAILLLEKARRAGVYQELLAGLSRAWENCRRERLKSKSSPPPAGAEAEAAAGGWKRWQWSLDLALEKLAVERGDEARQAISTIKTWMANGKLDTLMAAIKLLQPQTE